MFVAIGIVLAEYNIWHLQLACVDIHVYVDVVMYVVCGLISICFIVD